MIFLVHECIQQYCNMQTSRHKYGSTLHVDVLRVPVFLVVNQHGPFTVAEGTSYGDWISILPLLAIIGGDFNDTIWHCPPLRRHGWRTMLRDSTLLDPLYCATPLPMGPSHTRGGKRLDVSLVSSRSWDVVTPTSYHLQEFLLAPDHARVIITNIALPMAEASVLATPNTPHWGRREMKKFRAHFRRWLRNLPDNVTQEHWS